MSLGARPRRVTALTQRVEEMALALVTSLAHAHLRRWQEEAAQTPLAQLTQLHDELYPPSALAMAMIPVQDPAVGQPLSSHVSLTSRLGFESLSKAMSYQVAVPRS